MSELWRARFEVCRGYHGLLCFLEASLVPPVLPATRDLDAIGTGSATCVRTLQMLQL